MALRAVPDHPKFAQLKAVLGQPKGPVAGWLEMLWHFAGRFTPQGNIGKYDDAAIEAWLEWDGAPGALIAAFVQTRWLDRDENHRLLVHDWPQHADKATKNALSRSKLDFCTPTVRTPYPETASPYRLPVPVPVPEPGAVLAEQVLSPVPAAGSSKSTDEAHMIASAVIDGTKITSKWIRVQLEEQAKLCLTEKPDDMEGIRDAMIDSWKRYQQCAKDSKLRTTPMGAEKFFGDGLWRTSSMWGLKNGASAYGGAQ